MTDISNPRILIVAATMIMLAMFVAYMIFLVYTWQQLQRDRTTAMAKVDDMLDRIPPRKMTDAPTQPN